jgi:glycosyltransferase involved in cell wall biosynthesis
MILLRILLVINGTDFGGTEVTLEQLARALARRGHGVEVLSLKPVGPVGERLAASGVPVTSLDMSESVGMFDLLRSSRRLARRLAARRIDVVHSFLPRANIMSRLANRLARPARPHVANEESTDFRRAHGVQWLNRLTASWSDRILAVSPEVRDVLVGREGLPADRVEVLPKGIDVAAVDAIVPCDLRRELGLSAETRIVCTVGRLVPDKGQVYLVRALAAAGRPDVHLVMVGGGPEEQRLRDEATACGVAERVHLLGPRPDAVAVMKSAVLFCLPSLEEGRPITLLEAMASRLPIVATDVGSVAALVRTGETGVLLEPVQTWRPGVSPDPGRAAAGVAALAAAMARVLDDPAEARRLGAGARRLIEESMSVEQTVERLERLYGELLGQEQPRAVAAG